MITDYDIQRISSAIVEKLINDDRFAKKIAKMLPKQKKMLTSSQAADRLGITRKTVCEIASELGGVRGKGRSAHWMFQEDTLVDNYCSYQMRK